MEALNTAANAVLPILAGLVVLFLPGAALLAYFPLPGRAPLEKAVFSLALSISLTALAALAAFLLGVTVTAPWLALFYAAFFLAGVVRLIQGFSRRALLGAAFVFSLALLGFAWRLYQVRGLDFPAWVDPVQHALILRKMLAGGLPTDLTPFVPVPYYYHFGFHASAAVFTALTGLQIDASLLIFGQMLNGLVPLGAAALGLRVTGSPWKAGAAGLLTLLVTQMPAYYVTWGRYTLLTGMLLLPAALILMEELRVTQRRWQTAILLGLVCAGILLTHVLVGLVLAIYGMITLAALLIQTGRRTDWRSSRVWPLLGAGLLAFLLALPWLARAWSFASNRVGLSPVLSQPALEKEYYAGYLQYILYLLGPRRNLFVLGLAGLGLIPALRRASSRPFAIWGLALALQSLPFGLRVDPFSAEDFAVMLFLPGAILAADLLGTLAERAARGRLRLAARLAGAASLLALLVWGGLESQRMVNPATVLATNAERPALDWIAARTAPEARFLINTTSWAWGYYRGMDAGYWIQPLTGRWTNLPAIVYAWGEREYVSQINRDADQVSRLTGCSAEFWTLVREQQIDYVYTRDGSGSLQPAGLEGCPGVSLAHRSGPVSIYLLDQTAAP